MVNGCIAEFSLSDAKSTSTLRRHLAGETHNLKEYLSSGDVALGKKNEAATSAAKRKCDDMWQKQGVQFKPAPAHRTFFKLETGQQKLVVTLLASFDIVLHMRPFLSLRDKGRMTMARLLGCHRPSSTACRAIILSWLTDYLSTLRRSLANVDYICMTSDGWTNWANDHFAVMTLHFVERDFTQVHAHCVSCVHQRDDVISSEVLARDVDRVLNCLGWSQEKPLAAMVTDEGSNFRGLVTRALLAETGRAILDPKVICMDHLLKTAFEHALNASADVKALFDRCEKLSSICRRNRSVKSLLADQQLLLHQQDIRRPRRCTPILPVITRWGSHYDCMLRLVALRAALNNLYGKLIQDHGRQGVLTVSGAKYRPFCEALLTDDEWNSMDVLVKLLSTFRSIITLAQGEYYLTLATAWGTLIAALETLEVTDNDAAQIVTFKNAFLDELQSRFAVRDKVPPSALIALALDPRYKCIDVFHRYPEIREHQSSCVVAAVRAAMEHEKGDPVKVVIPEPSPIQPQQQAARVAVAGIDPALMNMHQVQRAAFQTTQNLVARMPAIQIYRPPPSAESIIADYRAAEGLPYDATQKQVLQWFNARHVAGQFSPVLAVARCCVFISVSSAPSERVASSAGQVFSKRRLRLHPTLAEAIVVLHHESQRFVAQKILAQSPQDIQAFLHDALRREHALASDDGSDSDSQASIRSSEGSDSSFE
jgi:hypothetical protein